MNIFFKIDGKIYTAKAEDTDGTVLPGVTRRSIIELLRDWGYEVVEGKLAIDDVMQASKDGKLEEVFGSGTAAVVSPVKQLDYEDQSAFINNGEIGELTQKLYDTMTGMQSSRSRQQGLDRPRLPGLTVLYFQGGCRKSGSPLRRPGRLVLHCPQEKERGFPCTSIAFKTRRFWMAAAVRPIPPTWAFQTEKLPPWDVFPGRRPCTTWTPGAAFSLAFWTFTATAMPPSSARTMARRSWPRG